jgi:hypothetical protein
VKNWKKYKSQRGGGLIEYAFLASLLGVILAPVLLTAGKYTTKPMCVAIYELNQADNNGTGQYTPDQIENSLWQDKGNSAGCNNGTSGNFFTQPYF